MQLQHTRNLGEKSKNKSIYTYAMYIGMDFPMGAQAGGDEHVHDSRPARGPGKYHTPTPPHPHTPHNTTSPPQGQGEYHTQAPEVFGFLFLVLGTWGGGGSGFRV